MDSKAIPRTIPWPATLHPCQSFNSTQIQQIQRSFILKKKKYIKIINPTHGKQKIPLQPNRHFQPLPARQIQSRRGEKKNIFLGAARSRDPLGEQNAPSVHCTTLVPRIYGYTRDKGRGATHVREHARWLMARGACDSLSLSWRGSFASSPGGCPLINIRACRWIDSSRRPMGFRRVRWKRCPGEWEGALLGAACVQVIFGDAVIGMYLERSLFTGTSHGFLYYHSLVDPASFLCNIVEFFR